MAEPLMSLCRQSDWIEVRRAGNRGRGGRGVFAVRDIPKDTTFERAPVLLIPKSEVFGKSARNSCLISWYVFDWNGESKIKQVGLVLGYGSLYNHSGKANAAYVMDEDDILEFYATEDITAGTEIFINYLGDGPAKQDLGFSPE